MTRMACASAVLGFLALFIVQSASASQLLTNGDFETGTFASWTVLNSSFGDPAGSWFIDTPGTTRPVSGIPTLATGGIPHGNFYAVSDQISFGSHVLLQTFNVPVGDTSVILTWDMFVNNYADSEVCCLPVLAAGDQIAKVDILTATASAFNDSGGVLQNCFVGAPPGFNPHPFASFACDITNAVSGGGTFQLRFGEADFAGNLNMGIDNVALNAVAVPEPISLLLLSIGLAGFAALRRTQRINTSI